jgi:hypothetical protein
VDVAQPLREVVERAPVRDVEDQDHADAGGACRRRSGGARLIAELRRFVVALGDEGCWRGSEILGSGQRSEL